MLPRFQPSTADPVRSGGAVTVTGIRAAGHTGMPLPAADQHLAQRHGLIGHDPVYAEISRPSMVGRSFTVHTCTWSPSWWARPMKGGVATGAGTWTHRTSAPARRSASGLRQYRRRAAPGTRCRGLRPRAGPAAA